MTPPWLAVPVAAKTRRYPTRAGSCRLARVCPRGAGEPEGLKQLRDGGVLWGICTPTRPSAADRARRPRPAERPAFPPGCAPRWASSARRPPLPTMSSPTRACPGTARLTRAACADAVGVAGCRAESEVLALSNEANERISDGAHPVHPAHSAGT